MTFQIDPTTGEISAAYTAGSSGVTSVGTTGIATGGPITTTGSVNVAGSGNTTTAATAASNVQGAASGNAITADGSGNVQDSGVLLASLTPAASLSTAGQGYFYGPGRQSVTLATEEQSVSLVTVLLSVIVCQFILPFEMTVRNCSWQKNGGTSGKHHSFGIYNASGNKLVQAAFVNTATASLVETVSFTGVVLPPGVYYYGQSDEDGATSGFGITAPITSTNTWHTLFNKVATHFGVAAHAAAVSGGLLVLPSTLGSITPTSALTAYGLSCPLWET